MSRRQVGNCQVASVANLSRKSLINTAPSSQCAVHSVLVAPIERDRER